MDSVRTARRLSGNVTIVYRRMRAKIGAWRRAAPRNQRVIQIKVLQAPNKFVGNAKTNFVTHTILDVMDLGEPDAAAWCHRRNRIDGR